MEATRCLQSCVRSSSASRQCTVLRTARMPLRERTAPTKPETTSLAGEVGCSRTFGMLEACDGIARPGLLLASWIGTGLVPLLLCCWVFRVESGISYALQLQLKGRVPIPVLPHIHNHIHNHYLFTTSDKHIRWLQYIIGYLSFP
jgi:hypothetical protein